MGTILVFIVGWVLGMCFGFMLGVAAGLCHEQDQKRIQDKIRIEQNWEQQ